jgi:hypothetical protein
MVLTSADGGTSWRFARLADFANGVDAREPTEPRTGAGAQASAPQEQ